MLYRIVIVAALLVLASIGNSTRAADRTAKPVPSYDQSAIAHRGYFYVGALMSASRASSGCMSRCMSKS